MTQQRWTRTPRVVVGVDDSPAARWALAWAIGEARLRDLPLLMVHAIPPAEAGIRSAGIPMPGDVATLQRECAVALCEMLADMTVPTDLEVITACPYGYPAETLTRLTHDGDLLVIGRSGRGRLSRMLTGSVGGYCARHSPATLVVVPVPSFTTLEEILDGAPTRRRSRTGRVSRTKRRPRPFQLLRYGAPQGIGDAEWRPPPPRP
ncbi:MAG TPA: universal stress protein [Streptosporangiaceae bacterium]|jgi:nucleotide-binding universal stress UspA family protein|nr:universal stress protein [Streptosporangiaceae bacterium]